MHASLLEVLGYVLFSGELCVLVDSEHIITVPDDSGCGKYSGCQICLKGWFNLRDVVMDERLAWKLPNTRATH